MVWNAKQYQNLRLGVHLLIFVGAPETQTNQESQIKSRGHPNLVLETANKISRMAAEMNTKICVFAALFSKRANNKTSARNVSFGPLLISLTQTPKCQNFEHSARISKSQGSAESRRDKNSQIFKNSTHNIKLLKSRFTSRRWTSVDLLEALCWGNYVGGGSAMFA